MRLDPTLELPQVRDDFDERAAPISIEKTGRGRFRIVVDTALVLESAC